MAKKTHLSTEVYQVKTKCMEASRDEEILVFNGTATGSLFFLQRKCVKKLSYGLESYHGEQ